MPQRADLAAALARSLEPLPVEIVTDEGEGPNPWRGYQAALSALPESSHVMVMQDDALAAHGLPRAVEQIALARPDTVVCLFVPGSARQTAALMRRASLAGQRYAELAFRDFLPVVAVLWPVEAARRFMSWASENPRLPGQRIDPRSDDEMAGEWRRRTKAQVCVTVPSIVQHPDVAESTIGKKNLGGLDKSRVAAMFAEDASAIPW